MMSIIEKVTLFVAVFATLLGLGIMLLGDMPKSKCPPGMVPVQTNGMLRVCITGEYAR